MFLIDALFVITFAATAVATTQLLHGIKYHPPVPAYVWFYMAMIYIWFGCVVTLKIALLRS